jgi:hypothetical protein
MTTGVAFVFALPRLDVPLVVSMAELLSKTTWQGLYSTSNIRSAAAPPRGLWEEVRVSERGTSGRHCTERTGDARRKGFSHLGRQALRGAGARQRSLVGHQTSGQYSGPSAPRRRPLARRSAAPGPWYLEAVGSGGSVLLRCVECLTACSCWGTHFWLSGLVMVTERSPNGVQPH